MNNYIIRSSLYSQYEIVMVARRATYLSGSRGSLARPPLGRLASWPHFFLCYFSCLEISELKAFL